MKISLRFVLFPVMALGLIGVTGCNKTNPTSGGILMKNSTAIVKAINSQQAAGTTAAPIPLTGGTLLVQTAWINIADLRIEENSGFDGEQNGEYNSGDQSENETEDSNEESGGFEDGLEAPDITAAGPFGLDISEGQAPVGSFEVYPGTFKKVDFTFQPNANDPFFGSTIVIDGEFTTDQGTVIPFTLKSEFSQTIQTPLVNGGIVVAADSTVEINVVFDLAGWFLNLDLASAQTTNGQILIDAVNNPTLLAAFEANLAHSVDVEEND